MSTTPPQAPVLSTHDNTSATPTSLTPSLDELVAAFFAERGYMPDHRDGPQFESIEAPPFEADLHDRPIGYSNTTSTRYDDDEGYASWSEEDATAAA